MSGPPGRRNKTDLTEGPVIGVMVRFAIPIVLANLLHTAYSMVDSIVVGRMLGSDALSAVSIGGDVMMLINLACNGLCTGGQVIIGQYVGARDDSAINRCVGTLISVFLIMGLGLTAVMTAAAVPLLRVLNTPETVWDETLVYLVTSFCGLVAIFGYNVLGAILRGKGDSKSPLLFVGVASVVNLILDVILVALLGVFGAALATVLAQAISFVWALRFLYKRKEQFGFDFARTSFVPERAITVRFFKVALPICLQNTLTQCATLFANSFIFAYGVTATTVNGIGNKIGSVVLVVTNSMTRSSSAMIAQNIAAKKTGRVRKVYLFSVACNLTFALLLSVTAVLFTEQVFGLFVADREVLAMSRLFLPALVLRFFAFATRSPNLGLINGVGKPKLNLIIGIMDGFVLRVGVSLLLGQYLGMGLQGYWCGIALGGYSPLMVGLPYFLSGKWKREKLVIQT